MTGTCIKVVCSAAGFIFQKLRGMIMTIAIILEITTIMIVVLIVIIIAVIVVVIRIRINRNSVYSLTPKVNIDLFQKPRFSDFGSSWNSTSTCFYHQVLAQ